MKICAVGAKFVHAEGRTHGHRDMTKLIVHLRNFAKAPNNVILLSEKN